jgi:hypothetical protein
MQQESKSGGNRQRRSREEVRRLVDEFEASGLDRNEFCQSRDLALSTLERHLRARRLGSEARNGATRLVAVGLTPKSEAVSKPGESNLEVILSRGRRIGVRPGFDPGTLRELMLALERA